VCVRQWRADHLPPSGCLRLALGVIGIIAIDVCLIVNVLGSAEGMRAAALPPVYYMRVAAGSRPACCHGCDWGLLFVAVFLQHLQGRTSVHTCPPCMHAMG